MTQKMKNAGGRNRSFGNAIPGEDDDNVKGAFDNPRLGSNSRVIGTIKGRYKFSKSAVGASSKKDTPLGLNRNFGNASPTEESRDPYKVNKNAG